MSPSISNLEEQLFVYRNPHISHWLWRVRYDIPVQRFFDKIWQTETLICAQKQQNSLSSLFSKSKQGMQFLATAPKLWLPPSYINFHLSHRFSDHTAPFKGLRILVLQRRWSSMTKLIILCHVTGLVILGLESNILCM